MRLRVYNYYEEDFKERTLLIGFSSIDEATNKERLLDYFECQKFHYESVMRIFENDLDIKRFVILNENNASVYYRNNIVFEHIKDMINNEKYSVVQNGNKYIIRFQIDEKHFTKEVEAIYNAKPYNTDMDKDIIEEKINWYKWKGQKFNKDYSECIDLYERYYLKGTDE